ncbi:hypothetical protein Tco_1311020 [Tanacetum coccineum]
MVKKHKRHPTPDPEWNTSKTNYDGPTQNWLSDLAKAEKPSKMFNELMSTPINFTAFAMNRLQISDLTKVDLVGPVYNLLKGTYKSFVELEYNMEECYKALNDKLDWNNPEGDRYPFDLSKPLPLRKHQQNIYDFLTKMKAAKYDLHGIEDMVPMLWSPIKVAYDRHDLLGSSTSKARTFYQKKLNISRLLTHKAGISDLEPYTPYSNPQGVIYLDKLERNRPMYTHELYKFSDSTLISVRDKLKDITNNLELWYSSAMPRMRWSNLEKKQSRNIVKDIDRQVLERRLLRSLEKFVGRREYWEDFRLL